MHNCVGGELRGDQNGFVSLRETRQPPGQRGPRNSDLHFGAALPDPFGLGNLTRQQCDLPADLEWEAPQSDLPAASLGV
jgi:hypothetical protein